jgi:RND family efflux transporter MFP subunit
VGVVVADETLVRHVHTKTPGWIETLHVNFRGQEVRAGEPILDLYAPVLFASQEEFLRAKATAAKFAGNADEGLRRLGQQLLDSARRRLELFDVPASFIAELEKEGTPRRAVTLNAPVPGVVTAKSIFEGQQVEPGFELFTVTDLSRVWIEADFYEYEASQVAIGQTADLSLAYEPGRRMEGRVTYVYPFLNQETRTLKVRFEFANPELALKPGMFADVAVNLATRHGVVIPDSAVMDTGTRQLIFVEIAPGTFEPRAVTLGTRGSGKVMILSGVAAGEAVVVRANFLIDSESRLRGAISRQGEGK